jgi:hypothetical protein
VQKVLLNFLLDLLELISLTLLRKCISLSSKDQLMKSRSSSVANCRSTVPLIVVFNPVVTADEKGVWTASISHLIEFISFPNALLTTQRISHPSTDKDMDLRRILDSSFRPALLFIRTVMIRDLCNFPLIIIEQTQLRQYRRKLK